MPFVAEPPPQRRGFVPDVTAPGQLSDPSQVAPRPEDVAEQREAVRARTAERGYREKFQKENADKGVLMDLDAELPAGLRSRVSFEPDLSKQAELIGKRDDVLSARPSKDGKNVIVRVNDEGGNPKDVLLHPLNQKITAGDVAGATAPILKGTAAAGLALASSGLSAPATAALMGGGMAQIEAASTGGSRILAGQDVNPGDVLKRAAGEGALNAALPLAGQAVKSGAKALVSAGKGEATREAAKRLGAPLMPSMARDSQALANAERRSIVGTKGFEEEQRGSLSAAKDRQLGPSGRSTVLSEGEVGERVAPIAAGEEQAAATGVRNAMTTAEQAAVNEIQSSLDKGFVPAKTSTSDVGNFIREKIAGKGPDSKASILRSQDEKLFGEVNRLADAENLVIQPKAVEKLAGELSAADKKALLALTPGIGKIPQISAILNKSEAAIPGQPTGLVDAFDRPLMGAGTPEVPPPPLTLSNARELRRTAYDLANAPGAPGQAGTTKEQLMRLYRALDEDMKSAIGGASPELKAANEAAENFHKTNIQPLQQSDVAKLFAATDEAGRLGGDEVVRRLFSGKGNLDALRAYRDVLGADSPEWKLLVRQGMQTAIEDAGSRTGRVDAGAFLKRLQSLNSTELGDEILGPTGKSIVSDAKLAARAQGVKLSPEELNDAISASPGSAGKLLKQAIDRELAYDKAYNTQFQKALRDGTLGPRTIGKPEDFVDRMVFESGATEPELRQAMTMIAAKDPAAAEGIRQNTLLKILRDARASLEPGEMATEAMNVQKLVDFARGKEGHTARVVLGKEGTQFLDDLATYAAANEKRLALPGQIKAGTEDVGRAAAAAIGHKISLARLAVDTVAAGPRYAFGTAVNASPAIREYLASGTLPTLGPKMKAVAAAVRPFALAGPEILSEAADPEAAPPPKAEKPKRKFKVTEVKE